MSIYNNLDEMKMTAVHLAKKHNCNYNIIIMNHEDGAFNENGGSTYEMVRDSYFETERPNVVKLHDTDELIQIEKL